MDIVARTSDDKIWAEWFTFIALKAINAKEADRLALKTKIDFLTLQRMQGISFDDAIDAFYNQPEAATDEPFKDEREALCAYDNSQLAEGSNTVSYADDYGIREVAASSIDMSNVKVFNKGESA
jgi:hypothetical protein